MKKIEVNKADVIKCLAKGYTQQETAKKLNISLSTLKRLPFWKDAKAEGQKQLEERVRTMYEKLSPTPDDNSILDALEEFSIQLDELEDILPTIDFDTCIDKEFLSFTDEFMGWLKDDSFLKQ